MNQNNAAGRCICSFNYYTDRVHVFELPDENVGYISGWIFCFNTVPFFYSIHTGWEGFDNAIAEMYAKYLALHILHGAEEKSMDNLGIEPDGEEGYKLNDYALFDFNIAVHDAMMDAGYVMDADTGAWEYKPRKRRKRA